MEKSPIPAWLLEGEGSARAGESITQEKFGGIFREMCSHHGNDIVQLGAIFRRLLLYVSMKRYFGDLYIPQ